MLKLLTNLLLDIANLVLFARVDNAERGALLACTTCTARAVGIVLYVIRQTVVDDVRQVVNVESACCHICSHQQLYGMLTELLHGQVALLL